MENTVFVCEANFYETVFNTFNYFENYFFVDALSFVISRSNKGYISSKIFSKSKKKLFYISKKYFSYSESVSQSGCVLQVQWRFKFVSRSDKEKYFRNWIKIFQN